MELLVMNGEEVVGGKAMMFKGANSAQVTEQIKERVTQIQKSLPEGVVIEPYLVRDKLVSTAIGTVQKKPVGRRLDRNFYPCSDAGELEGRINRSLSNSTGYVICYFNDEPFRYFCKT